MEIRSDIVIVGGGPAGLTLAKFLAEEGIDFVLLEEDRNFYGKPCGEGITPSLCGYDFFDLYDSTRGVERITKEFIIRTARGNIELDLENIITDKKEVEEELARQVWQKGGQIRMGERVTELIRKGDSILVSPQEIEARVVVGADGFNSVVRKFMGIEGPAHYGIASTGYWKGEPPGEYCIAEFNKSIAKCGYSWFFPRKTDWNIGIGTVKPALHEQQFDNFKKRYPEIENWKTGIVPLSRPLTSYGKNTILIGDSASQVIALLADGILPGMICAKKAADILTEFSNRDFRDMELSQYEAAWRETIGKMFDDGYRIHWIMMRLYFSDLLLNKFLTLLLRMYTRSSPSRFLSKKDHS